MFSTKTPTTDQKFDLILTKLEKLHSIEHRLDAVETGIKDLKKRVGKMDRKLDIIAETFDDNFIKVRTRLRTIEAHVGLPVKDEGDVEYVV